MKTTALVTACSRRLESVAILRRGSEEVSVRWHLSKDLKDLGEAMCATLGEEGWCRQRNGPCKGPETGMRLKRLRSRGYEKESRKW